MALHGWSGSDLDSYVWTWTDGNVAHTAGGASPTITLTSWGTYDVALQVTDPTGNESTDSVRVTVGDTIAPHTLATVAGVLREDGVYTSAVDVTLTSSDACTGVKEIHYTINGAETVVPFVPAAHEATTTFRLASSGTYEVAFWAVDNAGRSSPPIVVPRLPVDPIPMPPGDYYPQPPTVTPIPEPGNQVYCTVDGNTYQLVTGSISPTQEITTLACGYAAPSSNIEPVQTLTIRIDLSPPVITITGVQNGATYALGLVPTPDAIVTDAGSGVASISRNLSGGDGYRLGVFTYTVTATDNVGLTSTASATYTVIATIPGLKQLVLQDRSSGAITDQGLTDDLVSILTSAENATTPNDQDGYLQDFRNKVQAQSTKKIAAEAAAVLDHAAEYVMSHN